MKKYTCLKLFIFAIYTNVAFSTSISSIQNGNWTNPTTWNLNRIPAHGDSIIVNHNIVLNDDIYLGSSSIINTEIIVNVGASIIQDTSPRVLGLSYSQYGLKNEGTIWVDRMLMDFIKNLGVINCKTLEVYDLENSVTGIVTCTDSLNLNYYISNYGALFLDNFIGLNTFVSVNNHGTIHGKSGLNSLINYLDPGGVMNYSSIKATNYINNSYLYNYGYMDVLYITNNVSIVNESIIDFNNLVSNGKIYNSFQMNGINLWNDSLLESFGSSEINLSNNLYNIDTNSFNNYLIIDGTMNINGSLFNSSVIIGNGSVMVQDTTFNSGLISGSGDSLDFCDQTPPPTYPYIDINTGIVDSDVVFCNTTSSEAFLDNIILISVYPNPTSGIVNVGIQKQFVEVYSIDGKLLLQDFTNQINLENYKSGLYFLIIKDQEGRQLYKEKLIKE